MELLIFTISLVASTVSADHLFTYKLPITDEVKEKLGYAETAYLNYTELTTKAGYITVEHNVTTEDGYVLTVFQMTSPNCTVYKTTPVLLIHGLSFNSDEFLDGGKDYAWPYLLANDCYNVWAGNHRGNNYGRTHISLNPDKDPEFWDFSAYEMGYYDIPAMADYILNATATDKLSFIGFSLGGHTFLVTCAERPEYNEKFNLYIGLGSVSRLRNMRSIGFSLSAIAFHLIKNLLSALGIKEVLFRNGIVHAISEFLCKFEVTNGICRSILHIADGRHPGSWTNDMVRSIFSHATSGTSARTLSYLSQIYITGELTKYDYGIEGNLMRYGNETAPGYNLTDIVVPTVLVTGLNDYIVDSSNVFWLAEQLPNVLETITIPNPFNHIDNVMSVFLPTEIYPRLITYLNNPNAN